MHPRWGRLGHLPELRSMYHYLTRLGRCQEDFSKTFVMLELDAGRIEPCGADAPKQHEIVHGDVAGEACSRGRPLSALPLAIQAFERNRAPDVVHLTFSNRSLPSPISGCAISVRGLGIGQSFVIFILQKINKLKLRTQRGSRPLSTKIAHPKMPNAMQRVAKSDHPMTLPDVAGYFAAARLAFARAYAAGTM